MDIVLMILGLIAFTFSANVLNAGLRAAKMRKKLIVGLKLLVLLLGVIALGSLALGPTPSSPLWNGVDTEDMKFPAESFYLFCLFAIVLFLILGVATGLGLRSYWRKRTKQLDDDRKLQ